MKNLFTYLKALWGAWGNLQSTDVSLDCRLTVGSPSGLDAKWKQNPFMRFAVVLTLIFTIGIGNVWGADVTYTFTNKSWNATSGGSEANWTSGQDGAGYSSGVQITTGASGAYATSPSSFTSISKVRVNYHQNSSDGAGSIAIQVGTGTEKSYSVSKPAKGTGTTSKYYDFAFSPVETGNVKITVTCSKNSIYIESIVIYYTASTTYTLTFKEWDGGGAASGSPSTGSVMANATSFSFGATAPSKTGHNIEGFYTNTSANSGVKVANSSRQFVASVSNWTNGSSQYTKGANANLYIKWQANVYTVSTDFTNISVSSAFPSSFTYTGSTTTDLNRTLSVTSSYALPSDLTVTMGGNACTKGTEYSYNSSTGAFSFDVAITGDISISGSAIPYRTITFNDNGNTTVETWLQGSSHATPTITGCTGYDPLGWTTTAPTSSAWATEPSYTAGGNNITVPSSNTTYYAVYTTEGTTPLNKFKRITSSSDLISGEKYVITNTAETYALACNTFYTDKSFPTVSVSPSSGIITTDADELIYAITGNNTSGYSIYSEEDGGTGIGYDNSEGVLEWYSNGPAHWLITVGESNAVYIQAKKATTKYLQYSSSYYWLLTTETANHLFRQMYNTLYVSNPNCCTELGSINGSVSWSNAATAVVSWDNLDHVSSWAVKYKTHAAGAYTTWAGEQSTAAGRRSVTITGLTPCTDYDFQIIANPASGYCEKDQTIEDSQTHNWTVTSTGVTNATASPAIPSTTCSGFSTTISPATGYALPADITVTNASKSWNSSTGALSISSVTGNVSITITPTCVSPVITADPADASYYVGDAPTALSVTATLASGTLTYLWKVSTNGGSTWSDATGTNNTFSYSGASLSTVSAGTLKFKCIVGNSQGGCTVESGVATITVSNASYFPNGKTIFIQAESSSAWSDANYDCVKAWFHTAGGSETAQSTYWLFNATGGDAGKKLFATVVPATGDLPYLDIQRFTHDCSLWRNKNGGCSYSDANGSNTIRSTGNTDTYDAKDDYIRWNVSGVTIDLYGDPSDDDWASSLASFSDQGAGVWTATYENYAPANAAGESQDFKAKTNYNGWIGNTGSNNNATLDGMHVGSTYDVTATLDIKDHSLEMSKTFVKGTVHFNLQGHGSAISDLTNVTAGSKISAPSPAPTDAAYDFGGWYKEPACTNAWNFASDVVNETMTLYAKWTPHNFTITYEGLAGASNTNPTSYTIETATIVLANPGSRTGYTFTGWTLGGSPITQIVLGTTGDKTITATWNINTSNLAVSAADHVVITATPASESAIAEGANRNVNYNKTVTLNCTPDEHWNLVWDVYKTGESSTKVALSGSGDGATFTMPDYAVTVSAVMTEAAYKTVCFKNNGEDIDGYASVKVYVGESPVAPTLTDGTSGDACDPTSDKHYGWTKETWTSTIATQSEIDERTGSEAVYAKSAALPVVAAEDPSVITYHAVWAAGSGSPVITPPTPIVYWERQSIAADKDISATTGTGTLRSNAAFTEATYIKVYNCTSLPSTPTVTLSGLNMSGATGSAVAISFYTRGTSASAGTLTVKYTDGGVESTAGTVDVANGLIRYHEVNGIPKTATQIKLEHSKSSGNLAIGTIRIFEPNTTEYTFTELDGTNTDGWTNNDWDGYYLITNASTYALDGNGIGEKNFATVSPSDNKIVTTNIGAAFEVTYVSENGYKIQGVGCGDYLNTASNSVAPSASVIYHSSMSYNSVVDNSSNTLKWNSSKFGFYASAGTAIKLYKILASYSTFLTTCCTQYDISGASTSGTAVTGGTLTSTDNSACEDREVKITANVSDGYRFDSWTITAGGSPVARKDGSAEIEDGNPIYVFDMPAADVTVSATFTRVYTVTYDANGGTGEMIDVNSPYAAGDKVTVLTNTFTKAGYNFDSWSYSPAVSVTDGKFDMPSSDVTITAQWTAKPLNNIILAQTEAEIYDQQYVQIDVTYDPADIVTKGYTLTGPALTKVVTTSSTQTQLKISATKAGVIISEVVSETVSIKANADETKTASVVVTIKPLPRVHFTDIIHNVVFGDVVEEIVGNVLSGAKTTPTHSDISDPGASYNTCERQHLHLLGWIESTWADAHPGATSGEIIGAGSSIYYEAGASINVEVQNGKTFYAVWCIVE